MTWRTCTRSALAAALLAMALGTPCHAQTVAAPFNTDYTIDPLGSVPGLPTNYGGLTFKKGDADTILIGGAANESAGQLYSIKVTRDAANHITGFSGTAQVYADAAYNDGGVVYGPGDVLFLARWPVNELGQIEPGSTEAGKIIDMAQFDIPSSLSALGFVPPGFPGAGRLKLVTYGGGNWFDAAVVPDGTGTYDLVDVTPRTQIVGGPEGFVYVPPGSPKFTDHSSMLVAEYAAGEIAAYRIDANGDPIPNSRVDFVTGLSGAEGAVVDPLTGDFLFSTFGGFNQVVAVRGFGVPPCGSCVSVPGCTDTCDVEAGECRTCGHPFSNSRCVVNAVVVLQGALGMRECELCTCDVDSSGTVNATDALLILRGCAAIPSELECPDPGTATTIGQ
ncbi:MAG TPA: hypothetical protein VEC57_10965 [Candidatus Limnocylindrales bacterium]|nr:hypothetical protein [Candidatus Limnocylindrales bacterium]